MDSVKFERAQDAELYSSVVESSVGVSGARWSFTFERISMTRMAASRLSRINNSFSLARTRTISLLTT